MKLERNPLFRIKEMKKTIAFSTLALIIGLNNGAMAQQGGFTGPSIAKSTVAEAKNLSDDTPVILTGKIEKSLGGEKYLFSDQTGSLTVEIDNEDWRGVTVSENDVVEIRGEIDKDLMSMKIDVDSVVKK